MSVHLPTAEMVELTKKTKIIDDLLGGTATMRKAAQTYLFQMEMEESDSYRKRLEVRPFILHCRKPFRK